MNAEPDLDLSHPDFGGQPLALLLPALRAALRAADEVSFIVPNPDLGLGLYAGESGPVGLHRSWAVWTDVADLLDAHLLTPRLLSGGTQVRLTLRRRSGALDTAQGYGPDSEFARADKLEDPAFLLSLVEALRRVAPPPGGRVLALVSTLGVSWTHWRWPFPSVPVAWKWSAWIWTLRRWRWRSGGSGQPPS
ncbi:hypothetical protein [Deinococcus radiophilus]|uniref:hypothetical protein n=1 Tax=Deinococcus radiophilus TaxID=32062 RepID=UPI003614CF2F